LKESIVVKRSLSLLIVSLLFATVASAQESSAWKISEIEALLRQRIDIEKKCVGLAVGLITPRGTEVVTYGTTKKEAKQRPDRETVFEIGSATKVFTTLILADMVVRGEIALDDPAAKYLPASVTMPKYDGREITLLDLATHTSALPRMPNNLKPKDNLNPYADYSTKQMYEALSACKLGRPIGQKSEYSNLGMGLLGHILELRSGKGFEALVSERIAKPLQMKSTSIQMSPDMRKRLARPYNEELSEVKNWDIPTMAGAGALRSTLSDMLLFVQAFLRKEKWELSSAIELQVKTRLPIESSGMSMALGWHKLKIQDKEVVWHNGQTGGYHSFIGFDPTASTGVVVLANTAVDIDDLGLHLLDRRVPIKVVQPKKERTEIKLDPKILDSYVGSYEIVPQFVMTVTKANDGLMVQATGQSKIELFAESETKFFLKAVEAQISFVKNSEGKVTSLILHQNGVDQTAKRRP
jgi:serine-type D-Ala-D-Ala carboxypeptidase/endopeptidase